MKTSLLEIVGLRLLLEPHALLRPLLLLQTGTLLLARTSFSLS
jgi:hypothetical protein